MNLTPKFMHKLSHQGDLLIIKLDKLPEGLKPAKSNIILEGEATGHVHRLVTGILLLEETPSKYSLGYVQSDKPITIEHIFAGTDTSTREHEPQILEPGIYHLESQREYDEIEDRKVID